MQDVRAWYHENIEKNIYKAAAWYDKQVLQPLKREPLTFLGRAIGAFVVAVGLVLACVYACAAIGAAAVSAWEGISSVAFWIDGVAIPAVTGFLDSAVWPGVFDFSWGQAAEVFGYGKSIIDGNPLGLLYSAFTPLEYLNIKTNFIVDGVISYGLGEVHEGWDIL